jgi:anti-sigma B factor antagonist
MVPEPQFSVDTATDGRVRVLRLAGDLVFDSAPVLNASFTNPIGEDAVVIDLSDVAFMDSSGLAALLYARKRGAEEGWTLTLRGPGPNVATVLRITARDTIFTIEP